MTQEKIDPELVDDRDAKDSEDILFELPEYDPTQFELPDDYEYVEVDGNGDSNEE